MGGTELCLAVCIGLFFGGIIGIFVAIFAIQIGRVAGRKKAESELAANPPQPTGPQNNKFHNDHLPAYLQNQYVPGPYPAGGNYPGQPGQMPPPGGQMPPPGAQPPPGANMVPGANPAVTIDAEVVGVTTVEQQTQQQAKEDKIPVAAAVTIV